MATAPPTSWLARQQRSVARAKPICIWGELLARRQRRSPLPRPSTVTSEERLPPCVGRADVAGERTGGEDAALYRCSDHFRGICVAWRLHADPEHRRGVA